MKRPFATALSALAVLSLVLAACAPSVTPAVTQAPQIVEVTRIVAGTPEKITVVVTSTPEVAKKQYEGVTINVLTFTGPQIAEPLQRRGKEFSAATGATINVITVPFSDLYQKALTDFSTGTNSYDVIVFAPQWMGDYVAAGYLEELTAQVQANAELAWEDIGPFFRDFSATYEGKVFTIPLDGDFHMGYYRSDFITTPPNTWEEYIALAREFQGKDLNGDGQGDYGTCIAMKRSAQSYWMFSSILSAYVQSQGTGQGAFFDTDTMEPLYGNNEAMLKALDVYKQLSTLGPPDQLNLDVGDTRGLFTAGRCALSIDWGDIGTLAIDPATSVVQDKVGAFILPGSDQVLDRATGRLVRCNPTICPYADAQGVNHAPYAAFGGWSGAINAAAKPEVKDAAFAYLAYVSAPAQSNVDVTIGQTGFNPYRLSQFLNRELWVKAGMSPAAASNYLGAIEASLNSPNMVLDLRIPQNAYYQGTVLDTALAQFLAGELTAVQAAQQIAAGWNAKTDELGRDSQLAAYKASLGVTR
ncbi:MAG: extracellular solute-binding protein [Anaerolineales bacterium]|nr:extracellular solute-binding protein [Anaerolineales bacterium]